ncbi:ABC transporter permease [Ferrovibrio sp.]|uniref:ABC transporter permease n=1 Tax=Ferrovibrio sp. TaxID=1917215 RepID=UPI0025B7C850|nr:ABC transporter permease [Ferrovibrio sp.]MBX3453020.1 ABC transporter permease [Ferrovibrio sp.]
MSGRLIGRERMLGYGLLVPAMLPLLGLFMLPLMFLLPVSLTGPQGGFGLTAYGKLLGDGYYLGIIWNSLKFASLTTVFALLLGYPAAFGLIYLRGRLRSLLLLTLFLPLSIGVIVKAFAWTVLLRSTGVVNKTLMALHIIDEPIRLIFTETALIVGAVNIFLPFMILPVFAVVAQIDRRLNEAAATLGAPPLLRFLRVTLPLSLPGIVAGTALVFALAVSAYVIPTLLMGERYQTLPTLIAKAFLLTREPAFGAAAGAVLLAIALTVVMLSARLGRPKS